MKKFTPMIYFISLLENNFVAENFSFPAFQAYYYFVF